MASGFVSKKFSAACHYSLSSLGHVYRKNNSQQKNLEAISWIGFHSFRPLLKGFLKLMLRALTSIGIRPKAIRSSEVGEAKRCEAHGKQPDLWNLWNFPLIMNGYSHSLIVYTYF